MSKRQLPLELRQDALEKEAQVKAARHQLQTPEQKKERLINDADAQGVYLG